MHRLGLTAVAALLVACEAAGAAKAPRISLSIPYGLEHGAGATLFVTDARDGGGGRLLRHDRARRRTVVAARGFGEPAALARHADGSVYVADVRAGVVRVDTRGRKTNIARIAGAVSLALDGDTLYVGSLENTIERLDLRTGSVTRVAGTGRHESTGDGGPAAAASVQSPHGLALDGRGGLYLEANGSIRRIDLATGTIDTFARVHAGQLTFARDGTLYFSQGDPRFGGAVKARSPSGTVTTFVSGPNLLPTDVLLARDGRALFYAQSRPYAAVRRLDLATRRITTVLRGTR